jgi:hypothetical protein
MDAYGTTSGVKRESAEELAIGPGGSRSRLCLPFQPAAQSAKGMFMLTRVAASSAAIWLAGCADVYWERAVYDSQRNAAQQCRLTRKPADPPCPAVLPEFTQYEKDRARLVGTPERNPPVSGEANRRPSYD